MPTIFKNFGNKARPGSYSPYYLREVVASADKILVSTF